MLQITDHEQLRRRPIAAALMMMPFLVASCVSTPSRNQVATLSLSTAPTLADLLANYRTFLASDRLLQVGTYSSVSLRALYGPDVDVGRTVDTSFNSVWVGLRTSLVVGRTSQSVDKQAIGRVMAGALLLSRTVVTANLSLTIDNDKANDPLRTILYDEVAKIFAPEFAAGGSVTDYSTFPPLHGAPYPPPRTHPHGYESIDFRLLKGGRTTQLNLRFGRDGALSSLSIELKHQLP
jgi:hypothetical protein